MLSNQAIFETKTNCSGEDKSRRSSKISTALKTRFLEMLQEQEATIKYAAKHLGINYSTAKVIAKQNRHLLKEKQTSHSDAEEEYLPSRSKKLVVAKKENTRCCYKELEEHQNYSSLTSALFSPIQIISTVSWNFLEWGLPQVTQKCEAKDFQPQRK